MVSSPGLVAAGDSPASGIDEPTDHVGIPAAPGLGARVRCGTRNAQCQTSSSGPRSKRRSHHDASATFNTLIPAQAPTTHHGRASAKRVASPNPQP